MNGFGFDITDDGMDDINLGELRKWFLMMQSMHDAASHHAVLMLTEPEHDCGDEEINKADMADSEPLEKADINAFFAYEESMLRMFKIVRRLMELQGWPVADADLNAGDAS